MSQLCFFALILFLAPAMAQDTLATAEVLQSAAQVDPLMALLASGGSTPLGIVLGALILRGFKPVVHIVMDEDKRAKS